MLEAMLILVAGGLLLGAALPNPAEVRPSWLRLLSAIGMILAGGGAIGAATLARAAAGDVPAFYRNVQSGLILLLMSAVVLHRFAMAVPAPWTRRIIGVVAFIVAVLAGSNLLHEVMLGRGTAVAVPPKALSIALQTISCAGAAVVAGVAFGYALFPLFGVTDPLPSARAFRRLHRALLAVLSIRAAASVAGVLAFSRVAAASGNAIDVDARLAAARWLVGIVLPAILAELAYRRAAAARTLSAAAWLLVAALCCLNGEVIALVLLRDTGLPF